MFATNYNEHNLKRTSGLILCTATYRASVGESIEASMNEIFQSQRQTTLDLIITFLNQ
jgi:hypothetical protein